MNKDNFNRVTVLLMTLLVSALFLSMIRGLLMAILMAAIFSGLLYPMYSRFVKRFGGRTSLASIVVILLFVFVILIPLAGLLAVVVDQAINASKTIGPILKERLSEPGNILDDLNDIPIVHQVFPDHSKFLEAIEGVIKGIGNFVIDNLGHISTGAVRFFFDFFVTLFTMYYFLIYGKQYLEWLLYCLPLNSEEENLLLSKFTTVTRATLKGTFVIGAIQGALGGIGMALAGIPNTLFWGVIMAVFSIIPAVGPAIIWAPAAVYLIATGNTMAGVGLALFGLIVVGNIDNLIRPKLVGKEAELPDLMIFFGTLGGLALFGAAGIIIGPIVAALFVSLWDIYAKTFREQLDPSHLVIKGETVIDEVIPNELIDSSEEEKELKKSKGKKKGNH